MYIHLNQNAEKSAAVSFGVLLTPSLPVAGGFSPEGGGCAGENVYGCEV